MKTLFAYMMAAVICCGSMVCGCSKKAGKAPDHLYLMYKIKYDRSLKKDVQLWGYIDRAGEVIIQAQFEEARPFSEGRAAVKVKGLWGYIDTTERFIVEPEYTWAYSFSEGLARVNIDGKRSLFPLYTPGPVLGGRWGFIDSAGNYAIPLRNDLYCAEDFNDGFAPVYRSSGRKDRWFSMDEDELGTSANCWAYMDKSGTIALGPFNRVEMFSEGLAAVEVEPPDRGGRWIVIDKTGKKIIPSGTSSRPSLSFTNFTKRHFSEGLVGISDKGYMDVTGKLAVPINEYFLRAFSEGLAGVEVKGVWGYIDKKGTFVIKPQYKEALSFHEGLAAVETISGSFQFVDQQGKVAIQLKSGEKLAGWYLHDRWPWQIRGFDHGLALIAGGREYRYIDKEGKTIFKFKRKKW